MLDFPEMYPVPLVWILTEHDPAAAAGRGKRRQRRLRPHRHLTLASRAAELFNTVGVHGSAGAPVAQIATAGTEGMRALDANIVRVKREGVAALHAVPLEPFEKELGHGGVTVIRVENVHVRRP